MIRIGEERSRARLTPGNRQIMGAARSPGMDESLAESMPSPGTAQPGRDAKPRPWPTGVGNRRPTRRGGGSVLRGCRAARRTADESPPPCGWRAGGRARDARGAFSQQTTSLDHYYPGNRAKLIRFRAKLTSCRIASAPPNQYSCIFIRAKQACYCAK